MGNISGSKSSQWKGAEVRIKVVQAGTVGERRAAAGEAPEAGSPSRNCQGEEGCGRRGPRGRQDRMNQSPWTMGDSNPWAKSGLEHLILHPSPPAAISYVIQVTITVPGSVLEEREGHQAFPTQPALGNGRCAESHCLRGARQRAVGQSSILVTVG